MILALDMGTSTGWAVWNGSQMISGSWELSTAKELKAADKRCCDPRVESFNHKLMDGMRSYGQNDPWDIYFEDVQFASSTYQVQLWASLRGVLMLQCKRNRIRAVPVGTLKKFATGSGNATKELMAAALRAKEPSVFSATLPEDPKWSVLRKVDSTLVTDDEVDARHLLWFARKELTV